MLIKKLNKNMGDSCNTWNCPLCFTFTYDAFGNTTEVRARAALLASYTYNENNGKLNTLTYGNGDEVKYFYDPIDRVSEICYNTGENGAYETVYSYKYDSAGRLYSVKDHRENTVTVYDYDSQGRPAMTTEYDADTYVDRYDTSASYNEDSKLDSLRHTVDHQTPTGYAAEEYWYSMYYNDQTGYLQKMHLQGSGATGWIYTNYDPFGRLTSKTVDMSVYSANAIEQEISYSYVDEPYETTLVSGVTVNTTRGDNTSPSYTTTYSYTYDDNGNITQITSSLGNKRYQYDDLGQLIREDNQELGYTYVYNYDDGGNLVSKVKYDYTLGSLSGISPITTYNRSFSGDKLTNITSEDYDGMYIYIEYDAVGNPVRMWEDGFDMYGYALEWEGRQLVSVGWVDDYTDVSTFLEFTYNADGIRTSKTYNDVKHEYFLNGSQVIAETWTQNNIEHLLIYLYDESSSPLGLKYRNSTYAAGTFDCYFFEKNLQGDIVAVYDDTGYRVGQYSYDAWGRCTVVCNATGIDKTVVETYNPFRYRGYFYDVETQMYYLQSRYYSPDMGRFFNGDGYVSTGQGLLGNNMYVYCGNNPVNRTDATGQFWSEICEFSKTAITEMGKAIGVISPAYAACGGIAIADGILPFGDLVALAGTALLTVGAAGYGIYQATQAPTKSISKAEEKDVAIPAPMPSGGATYYHVTTPENAAAIMSTGVMNGSNWEGGYVYAWKTKPSKYAIKNSGAHMGVIISFKTNTAFVMDTGITDPKVLKYGPVVSAEPGPIVVWDVQIVE